MKNTKQFWRGLFFILLIAALCGGLALPVVTLPARAAPQMQTGTNIVISQVYGGGGNANAQYLNDFIELFNPSSGPLSLSGWSIQYTSASGNSFNNVANLSGLLAPGQYYLVQLGSGGGNGAALPMPDAIGTANMAAQSGKVVLASTTTALPCNGGSGCSPSDLANIVDLVGYGAADSYEGGNAAPTLSSTTANLRNGNGCIDTDNNNADFVTNTPTPRNTSSPITLCMDPLTVTAVANLTGTVASELTSTANANLTGTASAADLTNTSAALTGTPTNTNTATITSTSPPAIGVVISEFRTRGPRGANDEFVELYNPTTGPIDISGWKINASNDTGGTSTRATIPPSTLLRSGQYYLIANSATSDGYNNPTVPPNLTYGTGISDSGGIALLRANDTVVDQVGMSAGSTYKEGTPLSPLTTNTDQSYERKPGGAGNNCQDTNNNANDFSSISPSDPQNYSSQLSRCGTLLTIPVLTVTTITGDTPDPSLVNASVTVSVRVTGGSTVPSGFVNITGANTNCTITLNASGTGSCNVIFTSTGTKTLTATYIGDQTHLASADTESHQVSTAIRTPTPTRIPSPIPPPPLLVINEFVPRPGRDWNMDGVINTDDEYIEILNHGVIDVNLSGYSLDDEVNIGSTPFRLPDETLRPGERRVFYGSETGLLLSDGGDGVRLLRPNGQLMDAYNYFVVRFPDQSFCRLPDNGGADDWNENCFPTPGLQNSLSGNVVNPPTIRDPENLCPIADTLPDDFVLAECLSFGDNIWNPGYWDRFGWYGETYLPASPGKWPVFVD